MRSLRQASNLQALMPDQAQPEKYWLLNLISEEISELKVSQLAKIFEKSNLILIMPDAKSIIKQTLIKKNHVNIICLTTIKKLLHKDNLASSLELPSFTSPQEALLWLRQAITNIFAKIHKRSLEPLVSLECHVIKATIAMEQAGLAFNKEQWMKNLLIFEKQKEELKLKLEPYFQKSQGFALFGPENIDLQSSNEVKARLEEILGFKLVSTSQSSLKNYDHEAVRLLLRYREHARMLATYGENFLKNIKNNRIFATFVPLGSASGRFSCHEPNIQALPGDPSFQACLKPKAQRKVLHFDYGAFELRILAALSQDPALTKIFNDDLDIHSMVAQAVFGVEVSKIKNAHLRDQAKILNFGLIYGMGEHALAHQLNISKNNAEDLMKNYFARFPKVLDLLKSLEKKAKNLNYVNTALGRRLYFSPDSDANFRSRLARNLPIQGTGADIAKLALCKVSQELEESALDAFVVNIIHDELVIECHHDTQSQVEILVQKAMREAFLALLPTIKPEISMLSL